MHHVIYFLWLLWDLPAGSIWSNLVASFVCLCVAGFVAKVKLLDPVRKHHDQIEDLLNPETPGGITEVLSRLDEHERKKTSQPT